MGRIRSKSPNSTASKGATGDASCAGPLGRGRRVALRSGLFALGLATGLGVAPLLAGDASTAASPSVEAPPLAASAASPSARPRTVAPDAAALDSGSSDDERGLLADWLEMARAERLQAMARKVTGAGLDLVAETVIDQLEEDALRSLIASTTDFSSAELDEIEDVPAFAMGLARIAMEGTVREASEPDVEVRPIDFSTEITWDHRAAFPQSQFGRETERIYAVFESDELGLSQTLAKWTRVDDGEIMLFERHAIRPQADSSFVYLNAPAAGWAPGEYRVDFYSADRELRWLASGQHRVTL